METVEAEEVPKVDIGGEDTLEEFGKIISPKRVYKNLLVISIAWVLQFTAFQAMSNLQSSLNIEGNVGVVSLAILYAFLVVSSIFLPNPMISVLGLKWTIAISQVTYLLYVLANIYPIGGLMFPAAILVGLGAAPLWTSQSTYVTQIGNVYAHVKKIKADAKVAQFFGIFFMLFQTSQIWGNLISYFVLRTNRGFNSSNINYSLCGGQYTPGTVNLTSGQADVPQRTRNILIGIYVGACFLSILCIVLLLDQRKKPSAETLKQTMLDSVKLLKSTFVQVIKMDQLLLIPLTIWCGLEQSFINSQFTQGLVTCAYGIQNIGLVFICFGICDAVSSYASGKIVAFVNRRFLLMVAWCLSMIVLIVIITWTPTSSTFYTCFILVGIWGVADGIYLTQMYAFYGYVFKKNLAPGYSNYRLWESVGYVIAYAYTPYIKVLNSAVVLIVFVTLGLLGFAVVDVRYNFPSVWTKVTKLPAPTPIDETKPESKDS